MRKVRYTALALAVAGASGCTTTAPQQCSAEDGSCLDGGDSSSGSSSGDAESSTGEESGSTSDEMTGTTTTGPMPCEDDEECTDGAAPICDPAVGECVSCDQLADGNGNEACADADAMAPLCIGAECVACDPKGDTSVCYSQLLVCGDDNVCGPCTEHSQCDSGACDIAGGTCFDPANVLDVGMDQVYTTIAAALGEVETMELDNAVLRLHEGTDFNEVATVDTGAVAFIAADGQSPQWINSSVMAPTLAVNGDSTRVYLADIRLRDGDTALSVTDATVSVQDCELTSNDILGVFADGATVDLRRSRIVQNSGGGIVAQGGATLTVENCFVGGANDIPAIDIQAGTAQLLYVTAATSTFDETSAIECAGGSGVVLRNSIIVTQGGAVGTELSCSGAMLQNNATEAISDFDTGWFVNFAGGDYRLQNDGLTVFADIAQWQDGDPTTDIDGDARPNTDGTPDYAGADVPAPR